MKPSSWDKQLGLALPRERAASQSDQSNTPSKNAVRNEVGLDVSHHTRISQRGGEKCFFLDILFHRMSAMAMFRQPSVIHARPCWEVAQSFAYLSKPQWTHPLASGFGGGHHLMKNHLWHIGHLKVWNLLTATA